MTTQDRAALVARLEKTNRRLTSFQIGYGPVFNAADLAEMHKDVQDAIAALAALPSDVEAAGRCHHCNEQPPNTPCWWCGQPGTQTP